jgi:ribonucleoside-triphosphate reductase
MNGLKILSDVKYYNDYSKYKPELGRKQQWQERVEEVMDMHRYNPKFAKAFKNAEFRELFGFAEQAYSEKLVLASQRSLQFAGEPIMKHNSRMYNCLTSYCDRVAVFQEAMYWLLSGCGVGLSFVKEHVSKLPSIRRRTKGTKTFVVPDSIEGWSDAIGVLMSSYVTKDATFKEYRGYEIKFDYSQIRPKGAHISGGYKAPGPDGLKQSIERIEALLERTLNEAVSRGAETAELRPIVAYDVLMHTSDAVLSGGVRRSATIALFSPDDEEMMNAKTGNWFADNPQRARSNNSAALLKGKTSRETFNKLINSTKAFGEPGFVFVHDIDVVYNPCVEIGMRPKTVDGRSGWQGCNLCEINGGKVTTKELFLRACKAAAIIGTLQAAYTDFKYVGPESKEIFDREALLGVSITGFMSNPKIALDAEILKEGARLVKQINKIVAKMIGINPAARTTCVKPSGNASVVLETTSGIHGDHAPQYFRIMQINKQEEVAQYIADKYPCLIEESVWSSTNADFALFVPVKANKHAIFKKDLLGVKQLEYVKLVQQSWVEEGTDVELCTAPYLRHNVSNTVTVDNWDEVSDYIFENQEWFAGISLLPHVGDKVYNQAPFTEVLTAMEIVDKYGEASMLVSGLNMDALPLFDNNLWKACDYLLNENMPLVGTRAQVLLQKDWLKRTKRFAKRNFDSLEELVYCMKDVHLFHKWNKSSKMIRNIDLEPILVNIKPEFVDVSTLGAAACSAGGCEVTSL